MASLSISWSNDESHEDFIRALAVATSSADAAASVGITRYLRIDPDFIDKYCRLPREQEKSVLDAMSRALIGTVEVNDNFNDESTETRRAGLRSQHAKMERLYESLGSNTSVKRLKIDLATKKDPRIVLGPLMRNLHAITSLTIVAMDATSLERIHELAEALPCYESLQSISYYTPTQWLSRLLAPLDVVPTLRDVSFRTDSDSVTLEGAQAMANMLMANTGLELKLQGFVFTDTQEAHQVLCRGIAGAGLRAFSMKDCDDLDAGALASALAASLQLQRLRIGSIGFATPSPEPSDTAAASAVDRTEANVHSRPFFETLMPGLPNMSHLEELDIDLAGAGANDQTSGAFVRAVARCPQLKRLRIGIEGYSTILDDALAECLQINKQHIKEIELYGSKFCGVGVFSKVAPALIRALETNYSVRQIQYTPLNMGGGIRISNPFKADTAKSLSILLRLNNAGRAYLEHDPTNASKAIDLLGQVSDDLDCLFIHLRENPFGRGHRKLAEGKASATKKGRKRKGRSC